MKPPVPKTRAEWQIAADAAAGALALDSMRQYGIVTGGPGVDVDRCDELLRRAAARKIVPAADATERFLLALLAEQRARW